MNTVRAKKGLGQHFLIDETIAQEIVNSLSAEAVAVLEVGAGMGILTKFLLQKENIDLQVVEIDRESVSYLHTHYPELESRIVAADFLKLDLSAMFVDNFSVIGNFPYNISSQILFKVLDYKDYISEVVGMFQKEVAVRIASPSGKKDYGILSVLLQAFYDIEYLFTVEPNRFNPCPRVQSAVIRMRRNAVERLDCDEPVFKTVVKMAFNQRRKMLRNSLKTIPFPECFTQEKIFEKRPEQLSVGDFVYLARNVLV
jgi:16S rRNA (adenine1518-N6/adenine1519-N6)-dimethyltransferase